MLLTDTNTTAHPQLTLVSVTSLLGTGINYKSVPSIQIYFCEGGGKFFLSFTEMGTKLQPKARGPIAGSGVLSSEPPPHQLGIWGSAVNSPSGSGAEPCKMWNLVQLETSKVTTKLLYNVQVTPGTTERPKLSGVKRYSRPSTPQDRHHCYRCSWEFRITYIST